MSLGPGPGAPKEGARSPGSAPRPRMLSLLFPDILGKIVDGWAAGLRALGPTMQDHSGPVEEDTVDDTNPAWPNITQYVFYYYNSVLVYTVMQDLYHQQQ